MVKFLCWTKRVGHREAFVVFGAKEAILPQREGSEKYQCWTSGVGTHEALEGFGANEVILLPQREHLKEVTQPLGFPSEDTGANRHSHQLAYTTLDFHTPPRLYNLEHIIKSEIKPSGEKKKNNIYNLTKVSFTHHYTTY